MELLDARCAKNFPNNPSAIQQQQHNSSKNEGHTEDFEPGDLLPENDEGEEQAEEQFDLSEGADVGSVFNGESRHPADGTKDGDDRHQPCFFPNFQNKIFNAKASLLHNLPNPTPPKKC